MPSITPSHVAPSARRIASLTVFASLGAGCLGAAPRSETNLQITVAPLALPAVEEACYAVTVKNGELPPRTVWSRAEICSTGFGNGSGAITYVGPCDAQNPEHTVELTLTSLSADGRALEHPTDYVNPTANGPIVLPALCRPNADTLVAFNLTVMRSAVQGFFDIVVDFDDIFCSAKLDCDAGRLLFDPATGQRVPTAVAGLACTGGPGADTHLYLSALSLVCDGAPLPVSLARPPGNFYSTTDPAPLPFAQVASFQGVEQLANPDGQSLGKVYFNLAFALPEGASGNCSLAYSVTASDGPFDDCTTPTNTVYPVIHVSESAFVTNGAFSCGANGLDEGDGVRTDYTLPTAPTRFALEASAAGGGLEVRSCAVCGDGVLAPATESCDPPDASPCAYGEVSCQRCSSTCQLVSGTPVGACGDGTVQAPMESCDPPDTSPCAYGEPSCGRCSESCQLTAGVPSGFCGDGSVQVGLEDCDPPSGSLECPPGVETCTVCSAECLHVAGTPGPPIIPLKQVNGAPSGCVPQPPGTSTHCVELKVSCDDDCEVWLDGTRYHSFSGSPWWTPRTIRLRGVSAGCHVLGIHTRDEFAVAAGFIGTIALNGAGPGDEGFYVTAQTDAITVNSTAPSDPSGKHWSELGYSPAFPTAIQCSSIHTWNVAPWFVWGRQYYDHGAFPIWYNSQCAGLHDEAFARVVFTIPEDGSECDPEVTPPPSPVCGDGIVSAPEQCDPPSEPVNDCGYGQTCQSCGPTCQTVTVQGPRCGDGIRNGPEACDGGDVPTCAALDPTKPNGTVTCSGTCGVVASCSADPCFGQPTTYTGNITYTAGPDRLTPDVDFSCITTIAGRLVVKPPYDGTLPAYSFPRLTTVSGQVTQVAGQFVYPIDLTNPPASFPTAQLATVSTSFLRLRDTVNPNFTFRSVNSGIFENLVGGTINYTNLTFNAVELRNNQGTAFTVSFASPSGTTSVIASGNNALASVNTSLTVSGTARLGGWQLTDNPALSVAATVVGTTGGGTTFLSISGNGASTSINLVGDVTPYGGFFVSNNQFATLGLPILALQLSSPSTFYGNPNLSTCWIRDYIASLAPAYQGHVTVADNLGDCP